jgi:hypothetical protein
MHVTDEDLILQYYGELPDADRQRVDDHVAACAACRADAARLRVVFSAVDAAPVPEPAAGYERRIWAQVEARLPERRAGWWAEWLWAPGHRGAVAAVALLVVAAFAAGRYWRGPGGPTAPTAGPTPTASAPATQAARDRILLVAVGDHLEQTEMVLIELANADGGDRVNISAARAQAVDLVAANRLYRQTAAGAGHAAIAGVLEDLERALIEVARSPSEVSRRDLTDMLQGIEAEGLLFKLRVVSEQMREREEAAGVPARRAVS